MEQTNIAASSDICFLIDEFNIFIKNANALSAQYTLFRQKKIAGQFEKSVFKLVTCVNISSYTEIFNSRFIDEIKHAGIDKVYEKNWLVIQAYNDQEKDFVITQLPTI